MTRLKNNTGIYLFLILGLATVMRLFFLDSIIGVPIFAIISAIGINYLMELFQGKRKIVTFITGVILTGCVTFFSHQYFVKYPSEAATLWNYGMKEAITFAEKSDYSGYVMSSDTNSGCYAIHDFVAFVPFYTLYPPETYQSSPVSPWVRGSQDKIYSIGNYYLMSISRQDSLDEDYLYILRPEEIATLETKGYNWTEIHTIKDFHGVEHYKLVKISGQ